MFKHYPPLPLPHSFGPGTFALNSHTHNPLFEKNPGSAPDNTAPQQQRQPTQSSVLTIWFLSSEGE